MSAAAYSKLGHTSIGKLNFEKRSSSATKAERWNCSRPLGIGRPELLWLPRQLVKELTVPTQHLPPSAFAGSDSDGAEPLAAQLLSSARALREKDRQRGKVLTSAGTTRAGFATQHLQALSRLLLHRANTAQRSVQALHFQGFPKP